MQHTDHSASPYIIVLHSGFTLIEVLVVFTLMALFSIIGIASFSRFGTTQSLQTSAQGVVAFLAIARSRALSQVKPSQCGAGQLQGYQVLLIFSTNRYELDVLCGGATYTLQTQSLPAHITFLQGSSTSIVFQAATGTATAGQITINGSLESRIITVASIGTTRLSTAALQPTPTSPLTPTPIPTSTPTPIPTTTLVPTPTATPLPTPTAPPTPRPTATPTVTPTPTPAMLAFDAKSSLQANSSSSVSWSHTTTTQSNRILIVGVALHAYSVSVTSVTYNGAALTKIGSANCGANFCRTELWYLTDPMSGTHAIVVKLSGTTDVVTGALTYSNVSQTTPLGAPASGGGIASSGMLTLSGTKTTQIVIDAFAGGGTASFAPGSGQSEQWYNFDQEQGAGSTKPAAATSTTVTWSASGSDDWSDVAVALNPAP